LHTYSLGITRLDELATVGLIDGDLAVNGDIVVAKVQLDGEFFGDEFVLLVTDYNVYAVRYGDCPDEFHESRRIEQQAFAEWNALAQAAMSAPQGKRQRKRQRYAQA
jgi:hypothetical protein